MKAMTVKKGAVIRPMPMKKLAVKSEARRKIAAIRAGHQRGTA